MASRSAGASGESTAQKEMFDAGENQNKDPETNRSARLRSKQSLERLRDRIVLAVRELNRLREENASLRTEVGALKQAKAAPEEGSTIHFNESPAELRKRVLSLIETIDERIERARSGDD